VETLTAAMEPYFAEHDRIRLDNEARNGRHTYIEPAADGRTWQVFQVLVDLDELNDWQIEWSADLAQSREEGKPALTLRGVGPVLPAAA